MLSRKLTLFFGVAVLFFSTLPACSGSQTSGETPANTNQNVKTATGTNPSTSPSVSGGQTPITPVPSRIVFILDASGSMLGRVGQEEKMTVARRVIKESIKKLPDAA
jgi:hypothetical protein